MRLISVLSFVVLAACANSTTAVQNGALIESQFSGTCKASPTPADCECMLEEANKLVQAGKARKDSLDTLSLMYTTRDKDAADTLTERQRYDVALPLMVAGQICYGERIEKARREADLSTE